MTKVRSLAAVIAERDKAWIDIVEDCLRLVEMLIEEPIGSEAKPLALDKAACIRDKLNKLKT